MAKRPPIRLADLARRVDDLERSLEALADKVCTTSALCADFVAAVAALTAELRSHIATPRRQYGV